MLEREKVCSRRLSIVRENQKRLSDMHPKAPEIDEKTMTIKGLLPICEAPAFVVDDGDELAYLCTRCKKDVGGALEKQGAKITPLK
jgi:hypothetical protein